MKRTFETAMISLYRGTLRMSWKECMCKEDLLSKMEVKRSANNLLTTLCTRTVGQSVGVIIKMAGSCGES